MTAPARPFANSNERPWLTRAARRDIRRAHAVASELNLHSFAVHGVVWTLRHDSKLGSVRKNKLNEQDSRESWIVTPPRLGSAAGGRFQLLLLLAPSLG